MVNAGSEFKDTALWLRNLILSGCTDPISGTRASNEKFVMTSWPQREVRFPYVTVEVTGMSADKMGMASESALMSLPFEVNVWSQSTAQRDSLAAQIIYLLRNNRLNTASGAVSQGLFDWRINNAFNLDEEGKRGVHRKVIEGEYKFISM